MCMTIRSRIRVALCAIAIGSAAPDQATAVDCFGQNLPVCTWAGHSGGFITLGDTVRVIDFETLPDGSPSYGGFTSLLHSTTQAKA